MRQANNRGRNAANLRRRNQRRGVIFETKMQNEEQQLAAAMEILRKNNRPTEPPSEEQILLLAGAMRQGCHQGRRMSRIVWSLWNTYHTTCLFTDLDGFDIELSEALFSLMWFRNRGGSDTPLRRILTESGQLDEGKEI